MSYFPKCKYFTVFTIAHSSIINAALSVFVLKTCCFITVTYHCDCLLYATSEKHHGLHRVVFCCHETADICCQGNSDKKSQPVGLLCVEEVGGMV